MDNVDARTREHVVAVARSLNYTVSPTAQRLATGRTGTLGIVTPFVGRWYFTELFAGIESALKPYDLDLLVHTTEEPTGAAEVLDAHVRLRRRVDAAIVIGLSPDSREIEGLAGLDVPIVLIGSQVTGIGSVAIDDRAASRDAVEHLVAQGHSQIAVISGRPLPTGFVPENDRLAGYLDVLSSHGLSADTAMREVGDFTTAGGERAMAALLERRPRPTAVFSMSDEMAYGALRAMRRVGVSAGNDRSAGEVALIGFDDHDLAELFDLSTIAQPVRAIGEQAVELLVEQLLAGRSARAVRVATELVQRGSTS